MIIYRHFIDCDFTNSHKWMKDNQCANILVHNSIRLSMIDNNSNPITGIVKGDFSIRYYEDGLIHNLYGPAVIILDEHRVDDSYFYYKGIETDCKTQEEFNNYIKRIVFQ
jgi:hypothetical protein